VALAIYREISTGVYAECSESGAGDGLLPVTTTHDGYLGEVVETQLFVRNDDVTEWYEDIRITPVCLDSPSDIIGTATGHGVKLRAGSTQPTEAEWTAIDYADYIDLDDIGTGSQGDTSTYLPFWYRVECPAGAPADNKENIVLRLSRTANPV
jgi:hypothetical protein